MKTFEDEVFDDLGNYKRTERGFKEVETIHFNNTLKKTKAEYQIDILKHLNDTYKYIPLWKTPLGYCIVTRGNFNWDFKWIGYDEIKVIK